MEVEEKVGRKGSWKEGCGTQEERRQEEVVAKVVEKLIEQAPDVLERVLRESGAISEIKKLETQKAGVG